MKNLFRASLVLFLGLAVSSLAQAGIFSVADNGNAFNFSMNVPPGSANDILTAGLGNPTTVITTGCVGCSVSVAGAPSILLTVTYIGKEAGFTDLWDDGTGTITINNQVTPGIVSAGDGLGPAGGAPNTLGSYVVSPGQLGFFYNVLNVATIVTNANNDGNAAANFWVSMLCGNCAAAAGGNNDNSTLDTWLAFWGLAPTAGGDAIVIALDDSGAAQDDNHDDLIVHISARLLTPEPAGLVLLGLGLLGIAGIQRRRA